MLDARSSVQNRFDGGNVLLPSDVASESNALSRAKDK